jgi:hypothetical protein
MLSLDANLFAELRNSPIANLRTNTQVSNKNGFGLFKLFFVSQFCKLDYFFRVLIFHSLLYLFTQLKKTVCL